MSPFYTPPSMLLTAYTPRSLLLRALTIGASLLLVTACSTPGQQIADQEMIAMATQPSTAGSDTPYLGNASGNEPPILTSNSALDPLNQELADSVAVPLMSFLIIEPAPVTKNAIPSDVEKLVKARKYNDAIALIDADLQKTPRNVQLRFVKARLLIELRRFPQAKQALIEITQQFPELPEPYNNLAALAADQGQWIEARDYLELALKLRPTYAIASANLGEIYIRLGAQAYENAAKGTQYQRQYTNRAKALLNLLKPDTKKPTANTVTPAGVSNTPAPSIPSTTKPSESTLNHG